MDYLSLQAKLIRQRKLADLLRGRAESSEYEEPRGQMISGRFVGPSWSQHLAEYTKPIMARQRAKEEEAKALALEESYGGAVTRAKQDWQSSLPTVTPGVPERMGPTDPNNPSALEEIPAQIPDRGSVLKATMAGYGIPGNEKAAELYNRGMQEEQVREDKQAEARNALQLTMAQRREQQLRDEQYRRDQLTDRFENENYRRAETQRHNLALEEMKRQADATLRAITTEKIEAKAAGTAADDKLVQKDVNDLSKRMKGLASTISSAQEVQKLIDENTDPKTGKTRSIPGVGRDAMFPGWALSAAQAVGVASPDTNPNIAKVQRVVNDIVRQQAGLSQTISEKAGVLQTLLTSGSYEQKEFLDAWNGLLTAIQADLVNVRTGHRPEALEIYEKRGGRLEPVVPNPSYVPKTGDMEAKRKRAEELRAKQAGDW